MIKKKSCQKLDAGQTHEVSTVLFEIPGLRLNTFDAAAARRRVAEGDLDILTAVSSEETWIYFTSDLTMHNVGIAQVLSSILGLNIDALPGFRHRRLTGLHELGDIGKGRRQAWQYTSQTDIPMESDEEFNRWFDEEHLPRIAALEGTVSAKRYRTDGSPQYLACYDLLEREVQGSVKWRAAIESPWRDYIHRQFIGPRRIMLRRIF